MDRYEALKHAVKAHARQVDKCGQPYILHPIAVAEATEVGEWVWSEDPEDAFVIALLHDVLEDTEYRGDWVNEMPARQWQTLVTLTRDDPQSYSEYIERVIYPGGHIACIVKLADLWHNLSPERQACLPSQERKSLEKRYLKARDRIWGALGYSWWPEGEE